MIDGHVIEMISKNNEIGYYSAKVHTLLFGFSLCLILKFRNRPPWLPIVISSIFVLGKVVLKKVNGSLWTTVSFTPITLRRRALFGLLFLSDKHARFLFFISELGRFKVDTLSNVLKRKDVLKVVVLPLLTSVVPILEVCWIFDPVFRLKRILNIFSLLGWIPGWVVNSFYSSLAPGLIDKMYNAAKGYQQWKTKQEDPNYKPWLVEE